MILVAFCDSERGCHQQSKESQNSRKFYTTKIIKNQIFKAIAYFRLILLENRLKYWFGIFCIFKKGIC